jgi:hypothetical protein
MSHEQFERQGPTEKQKDFLNKLLEDENISKTDYSYIINFANSIIFNRKQYQKKLQEGGTL